MNRATLYRWARLPLHPGFSLLEIIFAASLLSLVLVMMFNLFPSALFSIKMAEHRLRAASQGQSVLEAARTSAHQLPTSAPTTVSQNIVNSRGSDGTYYFTDRLVDVMPTSSPICPVNTPCPKGGIDYRLISVSATTWWNERNDPSDLPTTQYHTWHHSLVQQLEVTDITQ